jgi:hypothetical protein
MKKIIAVFLAVLMVFTTASIAFAQDEAAAETTTVVENTTRNIKNSDGLVVPFNFTQLKFSVIFKFFEKIFKFIFSLFGGSDSTTATDNAGPVDQEGATAVSDAGQFLDELLSEAQSRLNE